MNYYQADPPRPYRIAKYALGDDYHNVIYRRLKKLCRFMGHKFGSQQKPYVDTGPLLEKPLAEAAGLGWRGKSTILIEPKRGTWSFLANIVTTLDLPAGAAVKDRCGSCTRCIDGTQLRQSMPPTNWTRVAALLFDDRACGFHSIKISASDWGPFVWL